MTKIAIISQPEQGVLIDIGGCATLQEATQHLTATLQVSSQFWENMHVDLNLGMLVLTAEELAQVMSIVAEVGVRPRHVFSQADVTRASLIARDIVPSSGNPMSLPPEQPWEGSGESGWPAGSAPDVVPNDNALPGPETPRLPASRETVAVEVEGTGDGGETGSSATAPAAATVAANPAIPAVMYLRQTLRSGQAVSHKGHLVIVGDVNPGAEVMADGDITVWGALRGIAHAGVAGNSNAEIRALKFQPIQLRIAHAIARSPDRPHASSLRSSGPETARIVNGTIRITSSAPD